MRLFRLIAIASFILAALSTCFATPISTKAQSANPALQPCIPGTTLTLVPTSAEATELAAITPTLSVVTTVSPITNLVYNIGGGRLKIHGLIPEGLDSHTFEPKPSDAVFISNADLVFLNGLHLEAPTLKLAQANLKQGAEIVELGTQTLGEVDWIYDFSFPEEKGDPNPHLWMNPLLALNYAALIRDTLSKRDPDGAAFYAANYDQFAARIALLDQAICDALNTIPENQRKLLTYHDSFAYFAPRYHMQVLGAIQPSDFSEPSALDVAKLIDQIKKEGVPAIFGSEVFPSKVIEQIGKESDVKFVDTLADDDLPNQTGDRLYHSYLQLMVNDATTITQTLGGDPAVLKSVPTGNLNGPDNGPNMSGQ
jgi:ABC-type Zn uptake system ZnuABC Zn-binding protein ZnuA